MEEAALCRRARSQGALCREESSQPPAEAGWLDGDAACIIHLMQFGGTSGIREEDFTILFYLSAVKSTASLRFLRPYGSYILRPRIGPPFVYLFVKMQATFSSGSRLATRRGGHGRGYGRHGFMAVCMAGKNKKASSSKGVSSLSGLLKKKAEAEEAQKAVPAERATPAQYREMEIRNLLFNMANSYFKATKRYLVDGVDLAQLPDAIYYAPCCILAHDRFQEGVVSGLLGNP